MNKITRISLVHNTETNAWSITIRRSSNSHESEKVFFSVRRELVDTLMRGAVYQNMVGESKLIKISMSPNLLALGKHPEWLVDGILIEYSRPTPARQQADEIIEHVVEVGKKRTVRAHMSNEGAVDFVCGAMAVMDHLGLFGYAPSLWIFGPLMGKPIFREEGE